MDKVVYKKISNNILVNKRNFQLMNCIIYVICQCTA